MSYLPDFFFASWQAKQFSFRIGRHVVDEADGLGGLGRRGLRRREQQHVRRDSGNDRAQHTRAKTRAEHGGSRKVRARRDERSVPEGSRGRQPANSCRVVPSLRGPPLYQTKAVGLEDSAPPYKTPAQAVSNFSLKPVTLTDHRAMFANPATRFFTPAGAKLETPRFLRVARFSQRFWENVAESTAASEPRAYNSALAVGHRHSLCEGMSLNTRGAPALCRHDRT